MFPAAAGHWAPCGLAAPRYQPLHPQVGAGTGNEEGPVEKPDKDTREEL